MNDYMKKSPVGTQSAMRMIWESVELVSGEPYTTDELSAKTDPERYIWEQEQRAWLDEISKIKEDAKTR